MSDSNLELAVMERTTGELVSVKDASTLTLAAWITDQQRAREEDRAIEDLVSDELLARMDQAATWTLREGDPRDGEVWEIKAPSPAAGADVYPPDPLEAELSGLIEMGTITEQAAEAALKRTVNIEVQVPWGSDPDEIVMCLRDAIDIQIAGHQTTVQAASATRRVVAAGIAKLRKIPGTHDALDRVLVTQDPPKRRVKVTLKTNPHVRDRLNGEKGTP